MYRFRSAFVPSLVLLAACGGDPPLPPPPPEAPPATGISIRDVDLFQVVQIPLVDAGADVASSVSIIRGKDAALRVSVDAQDDFAPREIVARLTIDGADPVETSLLVGGDTDENILETSFQFAIDGASVVSGAGLRVELLETGPDVSAPGSAGFTKWPATGFAPIETQEAGDSTKVFLVPVRYQADGSDRLPDTSPEQIEIYRARILSMYPVPDVVVEVTDPWDWNGPAIGSNGAGWVEMLSAFSADMHGPGSDSNAYYYGLFEPASSFGAYCGFGCVAGLSLSGSAGDDTSRSSIGLGYSGIGSADTLVHELGHAHGQFFHTPCGGAGNPDPDYPYSQGSIGVYGMDVAALAIKPPDLFTDVMGYCPNIWISDFTYDLLLERTLDLLPQAKVVGAERWIDAWAIDGSGAATLVRSAKRDRPLGGEAVLVRLRAEDGTVLADAEGAFYPADHVAGGVLFLERVDGALRAEVLW